VNENIRMLKTLVTRQQALIEQLREENTELRRAQHASADEVARLCEQAAAAAEAARADGKHVTVKSFVDDADGIRSRMPATGSLMQTHVVSFPDDAQNQNEVNGAFVAAFIPDASARMSFSFSPSKLSPLTCSFGKENASHANNSTSPLRKSPGRGKLSASCNLVNARKSPARGNLSSRKSPARGRLAPGIVASRVNMSGGDDVDGVLASWDEYVLPSTGGRREVLAARSKSAALGIGGHHQGQGQGRGGDPESSTSTMQAIYESSRVWKQYAWGLIKRPTEL
jgi:hypothetical protein